MKAALLAAGHGTRLGILTADRPKILIEVAGRPLLSRQLVYLESVGVTEVALNAHAHADQVAEWLSEANLPIDVALFTEEELLGTAGALLPMQEMLGDEPFVVLYGDVITMADPREMAQQLNGELGVIGWHTQQGCEDCGILRLERGRVRSFVEKPDSNEYAEYAVHSGIDVLGPEIFAELPLQGDLGRDVFPVLALRDQLLGYEVPRSIDVGTPQGLVSANEALHLGHVFGEAARLCVNIDLSAVDDIVRALYELRDAGGRVFVVGVGGGAGNASHAVADLRKLAGIEAYAPESVSEWTATTNDEGWERTLSRWLGNCRISERDAVLVFSVGGGSREHNVSVNVVEAVEQAKRENAKVFGVVGAPGGAVAELADVAVVFEPDRSLLTPLVESMQVLVWHAIVTHPMLAVADGRWEGIGRGAG